MIVDPGPQSCARNAARGLGRHPRGLLLTHIHLDHAGATGVLVRRFPDLQVYVHERGAPASGGPVASCSRAPRACTATTWGSCGARWRPVPEAASTRSAAARRSRASGSRTRPATPRTTSATCTRSGRGLRRRHGRRPHPAATSSPCAPTPPPDIDVEAWLESLDTIAAWNPQRALPDALRPVDGRRRAARTACDGAAPSRPTRPASTEEERFIAARPSRRRARPDPATVRGIRAGRPARPGLPGARALLAQASGTRHDPDGREAARLGPRRHGPRGPLARDRAERRPQHVRGRRSALSSVLPGVSYEKGMSWPNQIHNSGRAIVWSARASWPSTTGSSSPGAGSRWLLWSKAERRGPRRRSRRSSGSTGTLVVALQLRAPRRSLRVPVALEVRLGREDGLLDEVEPAVDRAVEAPRDGAVVEHGLGGEAQPSANLSPRNGFAYHGMCTIPAITRPPPPGSRPGPPRSCPALGVGADQDRDLAEVLVVAHQLVRLGRRPRSRASATAPGGSGPTRSARSPCCTPRRWRSASR